MNKQDRKQASALLGKLEDLRCQAAEIAEELRSLAGAEQDKYDNMPEGLQSSEKGEAMQAAADALSSAADSADDGQLGDAIDYLGEIELD